MIVKLGSSDDKTVNLLIIAEPAETETIMKGLASVKGSLVLGGFCYGTFYAEDERNIYAVTDDVEERVTTRDGEEPAAIIFLYHRK